MDVATLKSQLTTVLPSELVDELIAAHKEAKREFYLGGLRLSAVEGGRFCEAAFRLLEFIVDGSYLPLGKQLDTERIIRRMQDAARDAHSDAVRLHIPRSLRLVYDIRNKRNAAHLGDGIDPNLQDATLVISVIDWVLAEFIRLHHNVNADQASRIVDGLVTKAAPMIQDFDGFLKVLDPTLGAADYCLVLLYHRGKQGATFGELESWVQPRMRSNLRRTLRRLENDKAFIHRNGPGYYITRTGDLDVESRHLLEPE